MVLSPGERLGAYEILSALGAGGMGEVYRARDTKLGREVAIKILPEAFASDPERLARFEREAKTLASLNHPHIAHIYGFEQNDGTTALVMELVDGEDLAQRIAHGPIPLDEALTIARQIAEALEAAHEQGIIHRDLKPANVKVRADGTVKVLDFGLAKAMEPPGAGAAGGAGGFTHSPTLSMMATEAGIILGTAAYMSPEQAKGLPADRRSDIFSFGVVLYEMLSGRQPFRGETAPEILASVLIRDADLNTLPPALNPRLIDLLKRCLQKNPKQRWQHIGDVRAELETIAASPLAASTIAPAVVAKRPLWKRAAPIVAAALVGALVAGAIVWRIKPRARPTVARFTITLPEGQEYTNTGRVVVAISPDGTRLVYVANQRLYGRAIWEAEAKPITGTDLGTAVLNPVFSPDGQMVAFWTANDASIKRIPFVGGAAITICPSVSPFGMSWTRDGILIGQGDRIVRVAPGGGAPETIVTARADEVIATPQRLQDGDALMFTAAPRDAGADRFDKGQIVVQSLKDGRRTVVVEAGTDGRYLASGHLVYALGGVLFAAPFDPRSPALATGGVPVIEGVRRASTTSALQLSVSESGSLVYVPGPAAAASSQLDLALLDLKGGVTPLRLRPAPYEHPRLSPDGTRVAFDSNTGNEAIVWIHDLSGTTSPRRLTLVGRNRFAVWSPDGQMVAFQSDREGDLGIFRQRADGTGAAERVTKADKGIEDVPQSWSPDGRSLLYDTSRELGATPVSDPPSPLAGAFRARGRVSLRVFTIADKKSVPFGDVTSAFGTSAIFSPDGKWVAYAVSSQSMGTRTYVQPFPPTGTRYEIGVGSHPVWSADGKSLFTSPGPFQFRSFTINTNPTFAIGTPVSVQRGTPGTSSEAARPYDIGRNGKAIGIIGAGVGATTSASAPQMQIVLNWYEELKQRVPTRW